MYRRFYINTVQKLILKHLEYNFKLYKRLKHTLLSKKISFTYSTFQYIQSNILYLGKEKTV